MVPICGGRALIQTHLPVFFTFHEELRAKKKPSVRSCSISIVTPFNHGSFTRIRQSNRFGFIISQCQKDCNPEKLFFRIPDFFAVFFCNVDTALRLQKKKSCNLRKKRRIPCKYKGILRFTKNRNFQNIYEKQAIPRFRKSCILAIFRP